MDEYLRTLKETLEEKQLNDFWVLPHRAQFKPIKGYTRKQIEKWLRGKAAHYGGKHIAHVNIGVFDRNLGTGKMVAFVSILMFEIREDGEINKPGVMGWGAMVNYYEKDIEMRRLLMKDVKQMIDLCYRKKLVTDTFNGESFAKVSKKLL